MRQLILIPMLLIAFVSNTVHANGYAYADSYITIEGTSVVVEENLNGELNPLGLRFRMGMPVGRNLDIEAHIGFGVDNSNSAFDEFDTTYGGLYLKGYLPIGFNSAFYALGGVSGVSLSQTVNNSEFTDERFGFSYGAGLETKISQRADLTADYMRYIRDDGLFKDISAVSFGIKLYY